MNTEQKKDLMSLTQRIAAPTPRFFKQLRNIGLIMAAIAGTIMSAPITLPAGIITAAGYVLLASGVLSAVSQVTVEGEA